MKKRTIKLTIEETYRSSTRQLTLTDFVFELKGEFFYCGIISPFNIANELFRSGKGVYLKWPPFEIDQDEYEHLLGSINQRKQKLRQSHPFYSEIEHALEEDNELAGIQSRMDWIDAIRGKYLASMRQ